MYTQGEELIDGKKSIEACFLALSSCLIPGCSEENIGTANVTLDTLKKLLCSLGTVSDIDCESHW
jgi:hypothetical protein